MPVFKKEIIQEKGPSDAKRHREKQIEAIKKRLPEIISEESIITGKKKGKKIKIPIKSIEIPHFRPALPQGVKRVGIGQGKGKKGDIIAKTGKKVIPGAKAGNLPGIDYIETEIELEELIQMMLEDLGLPNLEEKETKQILIELGYKIKGLTRKGPKSLLNLRATAKEGIRRFWFLLNALIKETGKDEITCYNALKKAQGIMLDALELLKDPNFKSTEKTVTPFPIIGIDDEIFHKITEDQHYESQAVIIAMMDVSGSMSTKKKYFARSMLFWLVEFLRKIYDQIEIRFVIHHTIAKVVDEHQFFHTGESGGTYCFSAYDLAYDLIESDYPLSRWNVYIWHFSDGEDWDVSKTIRSIKRLLDKGINMLGYGEIKPGGESKYQSGLMKAMRDTFDVKEKIDGDFFSIVGSVHPILGVVITKKEHLLPSLKQFLKKER